MKRPACQRAWTVFAGVIVLAGCRPGDPAAVPPGAAAGTRSAPARGRAPVAGVTGPSGQVMAESGLPAAAAQRRAQGLAALDRGRFDVARQAFAEVLDIAPDNLATQALHDAATQAMLAAQSEVAERFAGRTATVLAAPPWQYTLRRPAAGAAAGPAPRLVLVSETRDAGGADADWLEGNGLSLPEYEVPDPMRGDPGALPPTIPPKFGKFLLIQAIHQGGHNILFYGPDYSGGRFVAVQREDTAEIVALFDFDAYTSAPAAAGEPRFVEQRAIWAVIAGGALLVSHAHRADARGSKGQSAYITAIDLTSGDLLWRSAPLVANAADFVVDGGHVFTGYGFPDEPAQLHVLELETGKTVSKTRLRSEPEYLFVRSGKLLVRCRDADYVFELRQGGG